MNRADTLDGHRCEAGWLPAPAKVFRPNVRGSIARPRLVEHLHQQLQNRVTVLAAPAGYGKTTLLAQFADEVGVPTCWCSLDARDRDPRVLLTSLVAAVAQQVPGFGRRVEAALLPVEHDPAPPDPADGELTPALRAATGLLARSLEVEVPDFFCLVLDDMHVLLEAEASCRALDLLLEHLPAACHVFLAGRATPHLPTLGRMRSHRQAVRLTEAELRLEPRESAAVVQAGGIVDASEATLAHLTEVTQGWPMAVALAVTGAAAGREPLVRLSGRGRYARSQLNARARQELFTFLSEAVLNQLPDRLSALLHRCSVLPRFTAAQAAQLLGWSVREVEARLDEAERQGVLLTRLEPATFAAEDEVVAPLEDLPITYVYRLHDLWRECLLKRLREQEPVRARWLRRQAARLLEAAGELPGAVEQTLAGAHWAMAARLIQMAGLEAIRRGEWQALHAWLRALPERFVNDSPGLLLLAADSELAVGGDTTRSLHLVEQAAKRVASDGELQSEVQIARARVFRRQERYSEAASLCQALVAESASSLTVRNRAEALHELAQVLGQCSQLSEATDVGQQAVALFRSLADPMEPVARLRIASYAFKAGQLPVALTQWEALEPVWRRRGHVGLLAGTLNNLGMAYYYTGDFVRAKQKALEAKSLAADVALPAIEACAELTLAEVYRDCGLLEEAQTACLRGNQFAAGVSNAGLVRQATDLSSHLARLRGHLDQAEVLARQAIEGARAVKSSDEEGAYLCSLAVVALLRGDMMAADQTLDEAHTLLNRSSSSHILARLHLFRTQIAVARRRRPVATQALTALADLLSRLGYHGFLIADARLALPALERGVAQGIGGSRFEQLRQDALRDPQSWLTAPPSPPEQRLTEQRLDTNAPAPAPSPRTESRRGTTVRERQAPPLSRDEDAVVELPVLQAWAMGHSRVRCPNRGAEDVRWRSRKAKELFFYLLCHPDWQRRDHLLAELWSEEPQQKAQGNFHISLLRLRRALFQDVVEVENGRYRLNPRVRCWFDAHELGRRCQRAFDAKDDGLLIDEAREAVALYNGPFLDDLPSEWTEPLRQRLDSLFVEVALRLGQTHALRGEYAEAVRLAHRVLEVDPYLEPAQTLLLTSQDAAGQPVAALHQYHRLAERSARDLQQPPGPAVVQVGRTLARRATR